MPRPVPHARPADLTGRTVLVTGASPGSLGFATARSLLDWGAEVVVTTRTRTQEAVSALGPGATGHPLELADAASVEALVAWLADRLDRLDVLVNNAGIHLDLRSRWHEPQLTADGHELHWRTNYLGTAHLTHRLLPLLDAAPAPRVVTVVSKLHARGTNEALVGGPEPYDSWVAYGTSKLGLVHLTTELSRRHPRVAAASLHPGSVFTHIADRGLEDSRVLSAVRRVLAPLERRALLTPEQGAQTTLHCVGAEDLVPGGYYARCAPAAASEQAQDTAVAARLWDETVAWLEALR
ncbi:MAG TPA: SDR family NAD(P)-dependent oxidoreductase [Mycobacteriales bacterium]|nr:SDR family NAD(P)-dependent oxidoreductase [Mycobacteriales bacterium]